jgi:hypothetical protein
VVRIRIWGSAQQISVGGGSGTEIRIRGFRGEEGSSLAVVEVIRTVVDQRQDMVRRGGEPQAGDGWRPSGRSHAEEAIWKEEGASSFSYRVGGIIGGPCQ